MSLYVFIKLGNWIPQEKKFNPFFKPEDCLQYPIVAVY